MRNPQTFPSDQKFRWPNQQKHHALRCLAGIVRTWLFFGFFPHGTPEQVCLAEGEPANT